MSKVTVYNQNGDKVKELELNPKVFGVAVKPEVIFQAVIAQQANSRQVLADVKSKAEVSGGGRKPWRQKGTGRARHGSIRSPLWRGGGITFGPTSERNFSVKINRKAKQKALLMSLSDKAAHNKIVLVDDLKLEAAKTKKFFAVLQNLELRAKSVKQAKKDAVKKETVADNKSKKSKLKKVLLILPKKDETVYRAASNVAGLEIIAANSLNIVDVMNSQYLLMPVAAVEQIEKTFVK
ncbi:MAG: 50S ribosomal protein L4 [Candidatus Buchananbacteria bacterium]|nr:50S ribosomal protein L4 [Candidatus Buchananbacteria bacterium]